MSTFVSGVASCSAIDTASEIVDIKGLDITSLAKTGTLNWEHRADTPSQTVGKIIKAKKIFSEADCSDENELYFWNKTKFPMVYIVAELLDDYTISAKEVAGQFRYSRDNPDKSPILGFSVEGSEIPGTRQQRMIITRSIARKVTLTCSPANKMCIAEIYDAPEQKSQVKDDFDSIFKTTEEAITLFKSGEGEKLYEDYLAKKEAEGPSQGGKAPKSPSNEFENQGIRIGTTKSGKHVFSHGHIGAYGFNPAEHKEAAEHHRRAAVTADNPKLIDNHLERMKQHNNAAASGGRQENRAALSLNQKQDVATQQGKQQVAKGEPCELHKATTGRGGGRSDISGYEKGVHIPVRDIAGKQQGMSVMGSHVRSPSDVGHGSKEMARRHTHVTTREIKDIKPKLGKSEPCKLHKSKVPGSIYPSAKEAVGKKPISSAGGVPTFAPIEKPIAKAIEAGSYNAAPSTLVNGAAYQRESMSPVSTSTGAEENRFHATKKKDWNSQAKDDYDRWPHKDRFEQFMAARMPHLKAGEIRAIGRTLALKKNIDLEKSLESLVLDKSEDSLKKTSKIDLVHYSSHPDLTEVSPKHKGTGVDSRTRGRDTWHPHSFYYKEGTEPESVVTGQAKHKYTTSIDTKEHPIYDIGRDPEGHVANSPNMEAVHEKLKEKGYHGFHNSGHPTLSNVVAMYHPLKVHKEKEMAKSEDAKPNLGSHFLFSAENPMHPHKNELKMNHVQTLQHLKQQGFKAHEVKGHYGSPETSIMVHGVNPQQAERLHGIASKLGQDSSIYSSGGKHEMRYHHGENAGKKVHGEGTVWHKEKPKDMYTTMPNGKHFTHNFNF